MATYKESGVDIEVGDKCSALAYSAAKGTFSSRDGMIGRPVVMDGGFSGALDFGEFYLIQNCDGIGSKMLVADAVGKYDTLGYDLVAMVADDAVCVGAETISITNTIDTSKVSEKVVGALMDGLKKVCIEQKIVIPGGEIAEIPDQVRGNMWNSTALGIVEKSKFIDGRAVAEGDLIIGLSSPGFRSNGFSLVRFILNKAFGAEWYKEVYEGEGGSASDGGGGGERVSTWGEAVLTPSIVYSAALLELLGRYGEARKCDIKAIAHITGGGLPGNITRVLGDFGAKLDTLPKPPDMFLKLQEMGQVSDEEAYKTWNMGVGMILISNEYEKIAPVLEKYGIKAQVIGAVTKSPAVVVKSGGFNNSGVELVF